MSERIKLFRWKSFVESSCCKVSVRILLTVSFAVLAFYQMLEYERVPVICTFIFAGVSGYLFIWKTEDETRDHLRLHPFMSGVLFFAALLIVRAVHLEKNSMMTGVMFYPIPSVGIRFFRFRILVLSVPAVFYLLSWVWRKAAVFISGLWRSSELKERRLYLALTVFFSVAVMVGYAADPGWFLQYDAVYSMDSGWVYDDMFSRFLYYDIRHPAVHIIFFPVWAIIHTFLQWTVPGQLLDVLCASCIQFINIQMLLLSGVMICRLSGSRWTFALYLVSYSVMEHVIFFEKYQIIVFLLVLYVYQLCRGKKGAEVSIVLAVGAMPTNIFLCISDLVLKKPVRHVLEDGLRTFIVGMAVVVCAGRFSLLDLHTAAEARTMMYSFGRKGLPIKNCLFSLTKMIHGVMFPLSAVKGASYCWTDICDTPSFIGAVVLVVTAFGIFVSFREPFYRICLVWLSFSIILFCVIQWSTQESPLFSILFTWALIPLFQKGFQSIIDRQRWKPCIAYGILLGFILMISTVSLIDIGNYLVVLGESAYFHP